MPSSFNTIQRGAPDRSKFDTDEDFYLATLDYWDHRTHRKFAPPDIQLLLRQRDGLLMEQLRTQRTTLEDFHSISSSVVSHIKKVVEQVAANDGSRKDTDPLFLLVVKSTLEYHAKLELENQRHANVMEQDRQRIEGQRQIVEMQSGEHHIAPHTTIEVKYVRKDDAQPQIEKPQEQE